MFNKKIVMSMCATVLVAALAVGGTMAFFTDTDDISNTIKTGKVKVNVVETEQDVCGRPGATTEDGLTYEGVQPGQEIKKNPTIVLDKKSVNAYVRAKINYTGFLAEDTTKQAELEKLLDINSRDWKKGADGYYYYQKELKPGSKVTLFTKVTFPITWNNTFANQEFKMNITADAIQSDYFSPEEGNFHNQSITSWKYNGKDVAIQDYTGE